MMLGNLLKKRLVQSAVRLLFFSPLKKIGLENDRADRLELFTRSDRRTVSRCYSNNGSVNID